MNRFTRKQLIVAGLSTGVILLGLGIWFLASRDEPRPVTTPEQVVDTPTPQPDNEQEESESHAEHMDTEGDHEHFEINGVEVNPDVIAASALPPAQAAAMAYAQQGTQETREQRQARLAAVFHPSSSAIHDDPPAVDSTYSPNTTATPTFLYSRWTTTEQFIVVTVALKVVTTDNTSGEVRDEVYQAWDVSIPPNSDGYVPLHIKLSDLPVVVGDAS